MSNLYLNGLIPDAQMVINVPRTPHSARVDTILVGTDLER